MRRSSGRPTAFAIAIGFALLATFAACGGGSGTIGEPTTGDGGGPTEQDNPADCPSAVLNQGTTCTREGLTCVYGMGCSKATAKCTSGTFAVQQGNCEPAPDACFIAGGQCTCGPATDDCPNAAHVRDPSKTCPQGPPNSGACFMTCCRPGAADAGGD